MSTLEDRKIVIKLPSFNLRTLLSVRFFLVLSLLIFSAAFAYWYHNVRPFFWVSSAHVEAFSSVLSADVAGRIHEMGPQEGDFVKKGQTLFTLDRDLIFAKHAQSEFVVESLSMQIEVEKERIGKAMDSYLTASSELDLGVGSSENVKKQLALMDEAQEKADTAYAKLGQAKLETSLLDMQLKKMALTAPFDGVILKRAKNPGAVVSFGDPVYTLCDTNNLWIEAEVPEHVIGKIALGTRARVALPAYPNKEFVGKVTYIGPATVGETTKIPIKVSLENIDISLRPGLSASVGLKVQ